MRKVLLNGAIFIFQVIGVVLAGQTCTTSEDGGTKFCSNGCCGRYPNEHCCEITVWIIVLGAVGGVVVIGIFAGVLCCCLMKKRFRFRGKTAPSQSLSESSSSNASLYRKDSLKSSHNYSKPASRPPLPLFFGKGPVYIHKRGNDNKLPPVRAPSKPKMLEPNIDMYHLANRRPSYPYPHMLQIDHKMHHDAGYNSSGSHSPGTRSPGTRSPGPSSPAHHESAFNTSGNHAHGDHGFVNHGHGLGRAENHTHGHHDNGHHENGRRGSGLYAAEHNPSGQHNSDSVQQIRTQNHYLTHDLEPEDVI